MNDTQRLIRDMRSRIGTAYPQVGNVRTISEDRIADRVEAERSRMFTLFCTMHAPSVAGHGIVQRWFMFNEALDAMGYEQSAVNWCDSAWVLSLRQALMARTQASA